MPDFASDTTIYTARVVNSVESVTVTATPTVGAATVSIMPTDADTATDGHQVNLGVGGDIDITIVVTAADNSTMAAYMVTVTRSATASDTTAPTFTVVPMTIDISTRTQAVRDAILATSQVTETDRTAIPSPELAAITSLTVSGVSSLMADDFENLSGITTLDLGGNSGLTTLPSGIFDALLDTLTTLTLDTALQGTVEFATASGDIEQRTTVALSVTLTTALPTAVQIPYAVTFGGAGPADAADFSGLADGMVTFAAGSTNAQTISVTATATATADVGGTATLTLGTPILTADTRTTGRLAASSLVSVGSTASHTLTVVEGPGATLSVTEEAAGGTPSRAAVFTLALTNLPTDGVDDVSVFFTMSGFAGTVGSESTRETRLFTFATTTGAANILVAGSAVGGNGASVIGDDDVPFERLPEQDFTTLAAENNNPLGLWSNGTTMWVSDAVADKIFAYRMPPTEE